LREDTQKLKEENTNLEGMVESHNELIMKITKEIGHDHMGEDAEAEDDNDDDGGDAAIPLVVMMSSPTPAPLAAVIPEEVIEEEDPMEMVPEQEAPVAHEVILADEEPEMPQSHIYCMLMRDYEESLSRTMDDWDDLDDPTEACSYMDEWFLEDGSNDRD
jgi:hypothetical protein